MLSNTTYILQTAVYQHSLKKCIKFVTKVYNIFNLELLFTGNIPRGVFCEQSSQKTRELRREIMQSMISVHRVKRVTVNGVNSNNLDSVVGNPLTGL